MINYKILQIKDIENTIYAFRPFDPTKFNFQDYEVRYEGTIPPEVGDTDFECCDYLFTKFNIQLPLDFCGHSLSMSDLVQLQKGDRIKVFYCDSFGWEQVK